MKKRLYYMTVRNQKTGSQWEEPLENIWVNADSPHADTHEPGMHNAPKKLTVDEVAHYARNIVDFFNTTTREGEAKREYVSSRLEVQTERWHAHAETRDFRVVDTESNGPGKNGDIGG